MATYFFSRLSILMEPDYIKKMDFLYSMISQGNPITYRRDNYKAINVEIRKIGSKSYVTGRIIKYAPEHSEKVLTNENKIEDVMLYNHLLADVRFIIDANESLFIFEENRSHIPKDSVPLRFLEIIRANLVNERHPVSITPITESYSFLTKIRDIKQLKKVVIKLHPSNPNNRERWKKIDEKLKDDNITDYKEVQENKIPGGSIIVDDDTIAKIQMGEDGYGKATAEGIDEKGERIFLTTSNTEVQAKADVESRENIEEEINDLQKKTEEIKNKPDGTSGQNID